MRQSPTFGLAVLTLLNFVNYVDRFILAAVMPRVKEDLVLTDFELGLLSNAFLVMYFVSSPLFGRFGDRLARPPLMAAGVALWSAATMLAGWAKSFAQMIGARALVGVGEAAYATISPTLIADYYPPARQGRAFAVFYLTAPLGGAAGFLIASALEPMLGWRATFYVVGFPGLLLAALTLLVLDPPRGAHGVVPVPADTDTLGGVLRSLARNKLYVWAVAGYTAYTFSLGGLIIWLPTFLERARGFELARANALVGGMTVITGLAGTFIGGYLGDRLSRRNESGHLLVCGVSSLLAFPFLAIALIYSSETVIIAALFAASFFAFISTSPVNVVIVNAVSPTMRTMAMAASIFMIHLFGDALAAPLLGLIADATSLQRAMLILPVMMAASGVIWMLATRRQPPLPTSG